MATILVVDDRPTNRQYLVSLLGYAGHRLLEAADGEEALRLVRTERPDLVISDILMPTMDGYEFVRELRADPDIARTEVIFYTATYRASDARRLAADCGVSTVLAKPADPELILDAVSRALALPAAVPAPAALISSAGAAAEEKALAGINRTISEHVNDLQAAKDLIDRIALRGTGVVRQRERELLKDTAERFSQNLIRLHATVGRLYGLVDMTLELIAEREPERMLQLFCGAARRIVGADCAAVGILGEDERTLRHFVAAGMESGAPAADSLLAPGSLPRRAIAEGVVRAVAQEGSAGVDGLPPGHPPATSFLGVRVMSAKQTHGVLYFTGKSGAPAFGPEDEQIAFTLAAELGIVYENLNLYELIQRHAVELQLEATQRKAAQAKVRRLNRVYAVLGGINAAIVRIRDRGALLAEACRIAAEQGGFGVAWLGLLDAASGTVKVLARAGPDADEVTPSEMYVREDRPEGRGTTGRALRERRPVYDNNIAANPGVGAVRRAAISLGYRSVISLPLFLDGRAAGALILYAKEANFFDDEEVKLLTEVGGDISFALEMIDKEARLNYLAYYDTLTGLPNRSLLHDRLEQQMRMADWEQSKTALVLLDVARFKMVNDSLGRRAGDVLLKEIAARLRNAAGEQSTVARLGADRFAITLSGLRQAAEAAGFVEKTLAECFRKPFVLDAEELRVSAAAGIALLPDDASDPDALVQHGETALKKAKETGAQYVFYAPEMNARVAESLRLESRLRRALENDELVLHYQPKVDARTRAITGLEALMRWNDPETGLVPPGLFIPLMEQTGLIVDAGQWAIRKALADHARWRSQGLDVPRIAVNVSALQLSQPDFAQRVAEAIGQSGASASALELEITESVVMESVEANLAILKALRDTGVQTAVDDFGTGYSSLAYVARLPVHALKIDRAFIVDLARSPDSVSVVTSIISLARSLGLKTVAEGVESEEQARLLGLLQCDEMQGYLFSPPVPPGQAEAFFRSPPMTSK